MAEQQERVTAMFDSIAPTYDKLNHRLSLGIDRGWRRLAIGQLIPYRPGKVLDVATGTADMAMLAAQILHPYKIVATDLSEQMMQLGRDKVRAQGMDKVITFQREDCMRLSFADGEFDAVTVAYGARNFPDLEQGLREMLRVTKPGGHVLVLELAAPRSFPMRQLFWLYSHTVMALCGKPYQYLRDTMGAFPQGRDMAAVMSRVGYRDIRYKTFPFGVCTMYIAGK